MLHLKSSNAIHVEFLIRRINCSKMKSIYQSVYKQTFWFTVNLNIRVKFNLMEYVCADTIIAAILNRFIKDLYTEIIFPVVVFDGDISK